jgi:hypothetical protein
MSKDVSRATRTPARTSTPPHSRTGTKGARRVLEAEAGEDPREGGQQSRAAQPAGRKPHGRAQAQQRGREEKPAAKSVPRRRHQPRSGLKVPKVSSACCAAALKAANQQPPWNVLTLPAQGWSSAREANMSDREKYRLFATHCLELTKKTADHEVQKKLLDMAQAWLNLAEQAEAEERDTRH